MERENDLAPKLKLGGFEGDVHILVSDWRSNGGTFSFKVVKDVSFKQASQLPGKKAEMKRERER